MTDNLAAALRRINSGLALLVGIVVLVTAGFVIVDITLRQFGHSFGETFARRGGRAPPTRHDFDRADGRIAESG